jgi:hypothetical protein
MGFGITSGYRVTRTLDILGCAFLVLGAKLWLIRINGSITPFWDQWDGEAIGLYEPYLSGQLTWLDLLGPHNEHRILSTRVLALLLLELSGQWDTMLQMVGNALLHVGSVILLLIALGRIISTSAHLGLCIFRACCLQSRPVGKTLWVVFNRRSISV